MNVHESERLAVMLEKGGLMCAGRNEEADIIIFNTCCIRNTAEQKIISHIGEAGKQKRIRRDIIIAVLGCLSAKSADLLKKKFSFIDIILGTNEIDKLATILTGKSSQSFGTGNSIIISHGCENFCSYCIVPFVRGKEFSRDIFEIEHEFDQIKNCGKTIFLLGQNVNSYRCPRTGTDFIGLLDLLCKIAPESARINFLSSHPKDFSSGLINCILRNSKIERNIHLPVQSGCDKILAAMNRGYTVSQYEEIITLLRTKIPDVHVTTDIICGFPGEKEEDFLMTCEFMKKICFDAAFIFPYSLRTGTAAEKMSGHLSSEIKKRRTTELIYLQRQISKGKL